MKKLIQLLVFLSLTLSTFASANSDRLVELQDSCFETGVAIACVIYERYPDYVQQHSTAEIRKTTLAVYHKTLTNPGVLYRTLDEYCRPPEPKTAYIFYATNTVACSNSLFAPQQTAYYARVTYTNSFTTNWVTTRHTTPVMPPSAMNYAVYITGSLHQVGTIYSNSVALVELPNGTNTVVIGNTEIGKTERDVSDAPINIITN